MTRQNYGPLSVQRKPANSQIVVKLKHSGATRGALRAAADDGVVSEDLGAFNRLLESSDVEDAGPIFDDISDSSFSGFRRMALAAVEEKNEELAGLNALTMPSERHAKKALSDLEKDPMIEFAYIAPEKFPLSADPLLNRQWNLAAIELFKSETAASFPDPSNVIVAVIDSGVDPNHPDLTGTFQSNLNFTGSAQNDDTSGHGTHVTGTIAALINNARGVRGIIDSQSIMSLKALSPYNAPGYYRALRHAITSGAKIINLSLGGGFDPTEDILIKQAIQSDIAVVAAMGNDKLSGNPTSYPAAIADVIAVGATDETDTIADFSQTGTHIDLVAPGVNILSTIPTYPSSMAGGTNYEAWPGTSMATPHVSAAIALMIAKDPSLTLSQIRNHLVRSADKVAGATGFSSTYGHGRLNIRKALDRI